MEISRTPYLSKKTKNSIGDKWTLMSIIAQKIHIIDPTTSGLRLSSMFEYKRTED